MNIQIITNNNRILNWIEEKQFDIRVRFINGSVKNVVFESRNAIMYGMTLVVDPLAGRRERANPCLSVIVKQGTGEIHSKDVVRVEQLLNIYYKNIKYLNGLNKKQYRDYEILDQSLIESAIYNGL